MYLLELFDQLDQCREESSIASKRSILDDILNSQNAEVFKSIVSFVFNPYRTSGLKVNKDLVLFLDEDADLLIDDYQAYTDDEAWGQFCSILHDLETRQLAGNAARSRVAHFFVRLPDVYRDYFVGIFNKDLKIGVGRKILEKHVDLAIPKFEVQLCPSKQWDESLIPRGGWLVTPKIDGIRGVVGPFGDPEDSYHGYKAMSRNGHLLYNVEHILAELSSVAATFHRRNSLWPVFDGEFYLHGWELSNSIVSTQKRGHPDAGKLQYHVFDFLTHADWLKSRCAAEACLRDKALSRILAYSSDVVVHVPSILSVDPEETRFITQAYVDDGYEGAVLKGYHSRYEFKRSKAWMKYKPFHDADVVVTKIVYGMLDNAGRMYDASDSRAVGDRVVKSLAVSIGGVESHVGTGLSMQQRREMAKDPACVIGKTARVRYQRISEDGRLIFPRLLGVRADK